MPTTLGKQKACMARPVLGDLPGVGHHLSHFGFAVDSFAKYRLTLFDFLGKSVCQTNNENVGFLASQWRNTSDWCHNTPHINRSFGSHFFQPAQKV
jgi:hypothetical protein